MADIYREMKGLEVPRLGVMSGYGWRDDPKRLGFTMARYKFVAKMLTGYKNVLEVGCGDGFASVVVAREVGHLTAVDLDGDFIRDAGGNDIAFRAADFLDMSFTADCFDAVYALDVLEHIVPQDEKRFMVKISLCAPVCIIGMPSLESQVYASKLSKLGHVNCKTEQGLKETMLCYFENVFMFGMNDEVVHTGFGPMCHYRLALGVGVR